MTVTKNEFGQQNMWATEPTMYMSKEDLDRYGIETYAEKAEKLNGRTAILMETSLIELLTYYVIAGALIIGAPAVFFLVAFMPALQNTKGKMVGYKDHKTYGDSSIYEVTRNT